MPNHETSVERYRRLAAEALDVANNLPRGNHKAALLQMADFWQRLADQHADATPPIFPSGRAEQPAMQQQQQVQPDDDKKEYRQAFSRRAHWTHRSMNMTGSI